MIQKISQAKKIVFITSSLAAGGAERNALNLASNLPKNDYSTSIISLTNKNDYTEEYDQELKYLEVTTILKKRFKSAIFTRLWLFPFVLFSLLKVMKREKYKLLIAAHEYNTFYLTVICSKLLSIPSILVVGNNIEADLSQKKILSRSYHSLFLRMSLFLCNHIICVSNGTQNQIRSFFNIKQGKISYIYNGIDIIKIQKSIKTIKKLPKKNQELITIGRLIERKGHYHLLRVLHYLNSTQNTQFSLKIIGDGVLKNSLKKQMNKLKLTQATEIYPLRGKALYKSLSDADIFVFSSYYEGFGNSIVEAMNCGLPIISTDCKFGPREIIAGNSNYSTFINTTRYCKYGILTPLISHSKSIQKTLSFEEIELANAILFLTNDKKMRQKYQKMSLLRARDFSLSKMTKEYDSVIKRFLYYDS